MREAQQQIAQIVPIAEEYIEGFHKCLDEVAKERLYLAMVKAPPVDMALFFSEQM